MDGLKFFQRTNSKGAINLVSWHSPHSLTWRFILSAQIVSWESFGKPIWHFHRGPLWGGGIGFAKLLALSVYRTNGGINWVLQLPRVVIQYQAQRPIWFKDMFRRARDERDKAKHEAWEARAQIREWAERSSAGRA